MNKRYPRYPDDADYQTNAPSYYEDLARKNKLIKKLAKRIWEYDKILADSLEEIEEVLRQVIDKIGEGFNEEIYQLLVKWVEDGTLDHIINETLMNKKADKSYVDEEFEKTNAQLEQTVKVANVLHYNVLGDGVSDDTKNIQKAIDNTTHKTVYFPALDYLISDELNVNSQKNIVFEKGSRLIVDTNFIGHSVININVSNVKVKGISFNGENLPVDYDSRKGHGITIGHRCEVVENVTVTGFNIENTPLSAITARNTKHTVIEKGQAINCSNIGLPIQPAVLHIFESDYGTIRENLCVNAGQKAIYITSGTGGYITGNRIEHQNPGHSAIFTANLSDFIISENRIMGGYAIKCDRSNGKWLVVNNIITNPVELGIMIQGGYGGNVSGNIISADHTIEGIMCGGHPTYGYELHDLIIANNQITVENAGDVRGDGIRLYSNTTWGEISNIRVLGNVVNGCYRGITVHGETNYTIDNITVESNSVSNTITDGLRLDGSNLNILNNTVFKTEGVAILIREKTQNKHSSIRVIDNDISESLSTGIQVSNGTHENLIITGNILMNISGDRVSIDGAYSYLKFSDNVETGSEGTITSLLIAGSGNPYVQISNNKVSRINFATQTATGFVVGNSGTVANKPDSVAEIDYI